MSTIKVDTIATRTGSGNITASNTIAGTSATLSGTLGVTGTSTLSGNATVGGTLGVTGTSTLSGNATVGGTLGVTGATSLAGTTVSSSTLNMSSSLIQFAGNISLPNVGACLFRPAADTIAFGINNGQRVSVNQHGLLFGTDTAAANALDDYEEGTFNPTIGGNASYSIQSGRYIKIGNLVHCTATIQINAIGTGSGNTLSGLPFTSSNHGITAGAVNVMYYSGIATALTWFSGYVRNNNTSIYFSGNNGVASTIQHNSQNVFQNGARVDFNVTYSSG